MALDTQTVEIPLTGGLNEGADARVLPPGSYTTLVNMYPAQGGILEMRSGYGALGDVTQGGDELPVMRRLGQLRGTLYGIGLEETAPYLPSLYSYVEGGDCWKAAQGYVSNADVQRRPLMRGSGGARSPWVVLTSTTALYVWEQGGSVIVGRAVDIETGAVRMPDTQLSASGKTALRPTVALVGTSAYVAYYNDTDGRIEAVRVDMPDEADVTVSTATGLVNANVRFDICSAGENHWIIAYYDSGSTAIRVKRYSGWGVVDNVTSSTVNAPIGGVAVEHNSANMTAILYQESNGGAGYRVKAEAWGSNLGGVAYTAQTILTHASLTSTQPLGIALRSDGTLCAAVYWPDGSDVYALHTVRLDSAGAQVGYTQTNYHTRLITRPFFHGNQAYAWTVGGALVALDRQVETSGAPGFDLVAYAGADIGSHTGNNVDQYQLPRSSRISTTSVVFSPLIVQASGAYTDNYGRYQWIDDVRVNLSVANVTVGVVYNGGAFPDQSTLRVNPWAGVECQGGVLIPGGITSWFDGQTVTECGLVRPAIYSATLSAEADALEDDGGSDAVYQYVAVHERFDASGNVHRSALSDVRAVTVTGGGGTQKVALVIERVPITNNQSTGTSIGIYRTKRNSPDGPYYRLTPVVSTYSNINTNDRTQAYTSFNDTYSDTELEELGYGFLYTDGGILESYLPPPSRMALSAKSRAWLLSAADEREVWYSRAYVEGEAPCFHPALTVRVPDGAEPLTAIASLGDKIVLFSERQIWVVSGDGPNDQGLGGSFSDPYPIQTDAGCVVPGSVVTTPAGVLFQSARGVHLLDSGLNVSFVGQAAMQTTRGGGMVGFSTTIPLRHAHVDAFRKRVRWLGGWDANNGETGNVTVFDYGMGQWYTEHFDIAPVAVGVWAKRTVLATATEGVGLESAGTYPGLDLGTGLQGESFVYYYPNGTIITPWIHVAGLAGFQRAKRLLVVAKVNDECSLRVRLYTDYDDTTAQQDTTWQLDATTRDVYPVVRLNQHIAPQKCSALRIRLDVGSHANILPTAGVNPWGLRLLGLSLIIGAKAGAHKVSASDKG